MKSFLCCLMIIPVAACEAGSTPESVKALTKRVADWQIRTNEDAAKYQALSEPFANHLKSIGKEVAKHHDLAWHYGTCYAGMYEWSKISDHPQVYRDWLIMIGERNNWGLHERKENPYHADDHCVAQTYLNLYRDTKREEMITSIKERFDWILANRKTKGLLWEPGNDNGTRWGWSDALFMAPPVWARMGAITGEQKYYDFLYEEYKATYDTLWCAEESLFWRDSSFITQSEENGRKFFWSRGNGWVFGGLALMIPDLPEKWEHRPYFIDIYKKMAVALKKIQREDGTWSKGLLGGVEGYPTIETSGTAFNVFGLAWGVNNRILDRAEYERTIMDGWNALAKCVTDEGLLGYVQPVGAAPGASYPDKTDVYGIGAFLAAGAEVYKLAGGQ